MKITRDNCNNVAYSLEPDGNSVQQIIDYWTPERKAQAISIMPQIEIEMEETDATTTDPALADLNKMPFTAGGKLFFSGDGKNYVASANVLECSSLLVTAAHCVQDRDTGKLYDNFLFERCYDSGKFSEKLTFKIVALKEYWYSQKKSKWDYAIVVLKTNSNVASPLKYSTENVENKTVTAFGYPANYYNGKKMVFVTGAAERRFNDTWLISGCKMGGGSSGGAWVLEDNKTIVGVTSYGPKLEIFSYAGSPIFDENFESLYQYALTLI